MNPKSKKTFALQEKRKQDKIRNKFMTRGVTLVAPDTIFLSTLPKRELIAGYAEVIKYGVIGDPSIFHLLNELPEINDKKEFNIDLKKGF